MAEHNRLGIAGENAAKDYLESLGYELLASNWRFGKAELDLVFRNKEILLIVEVKTRQSSFISAKLSLTKAKQKRLITAANAFIEKQGLNLECRFDLLLLIGKEAPYKIEHIPDAFSPML